MLLPKYELYEIADGVWSEIGVEEYDQFVKERRNLYEKEAKLKTLRNEIGSFVLKLKSRGLYKDFLVLGSQEVAQLKSILAKAYKDGKVDEKTYKEKLKALRAMEYVVGDTAYATVTKNKDGKYVPVVTISSALLKELSDKYDGDKNKKRLARTTVEGHEVLHLARGDIRKDRAKEAEKLGITPQEHNIISDLFINEQLRSWDLQTSDALFSAIGGVVSESFADWLKELIQGADSHFKKEGIDVREHFKDFFEFLQEKGLDTSSYSSAEDVVRGIAELAKKVGSSLSVQEEKKVYEAYKKLKDSAKNELDEDKLKDILDKIKNVDEHEAPKPGST